MRYRRCLIFYRGDVIPEATIQEVLRHAMVVDGLSRGLREAVKALDKYGDKYFCVFQSTHSE